MGKANHRNFEIHFDRITLEKMLSFQDSIEMARFIASTIPVGFNKRLYSSLAVSIKGFADYEFSRFKVLRDFLGDDQLAWKYLQPVAKEYNLDDFTIGINLKADIISRIPAGFYGNHPECLEIADYKTGNVPNCTKGIVQKKDGTIEAVKPSMEAKVKNQIVFECLFLDKFGVNGVSKSLKPLFGRVIYTSGLKTLVEFITDEMKNSMLEKLCILQDKIDKKKYDFNAWQCNRFYCEYSHVCLDSVLFSPDEKMMLVRMQKENREEASQVLISRVDELNSQIKSSGPAGTVETIQEKQEVDDFY